MALLIALLLTTFAHSADAPLDSLVAKVGREPVLLSDLERFRDVSGVLECAQIVRRDPPLPKDQKGILDAYIEEELMYQEARSRKISTTGLIPQAVRDIYKSEDCKARWKKLGELYSKTFRTDTRVREGESLLVRELEKRVLVDKFRKTEALADGEIWKREARTRYPVKVYLE